jgi:hypothetical protein
VVCDSATHPPLDIQPRMMHLCMRRHASMRDDNEPYHAARRGCTPAPPPPVTPSSQSKISEGHLHTLHVPTCSSTSGFYHDSFGLRNSNSASFLLNTHAGDHGCSTSTSCRSGCPATGQVRLIFSGHGTYKAADHPKPWDETHASGQ